MEETYADICVFEGLNEEPQIAFFQRGGKEVFECNKEQELPHADYTNDNLQDERRNLQMDIDDNSEQRHGRGLVRRHRRSLSPPMNYSENVRVCALCECLS